MTKEDKLTLLKQDLQMLTSSNDAFLSSLLDAAQAAIQREGIVIPENDIDIDLCIVQYAAYLFRKHFYSHAPRKRAGTDTAMPRFLRYRLNNIWLSQHVGGESGDV